MEGSGRLKTMTKDNAPQVSLEVARRDIDAIDDQLIALLAQRFGMTARVRAAKAEEAQHWPLPLRPAREAQIMRRVVSAGKDHSLSPQLMVRLWRAIINQSGLNQSSITVHVSRHLKANQALRLAVHDYFSGLPVEEYRDEAQALMQINADPSGLCVVETEQPWAEAFMSGQAGKAQIIASLPLISGEVAQPSLLVFGQAPLDESGDDETLIISSGRMPRDFALAPVWQAKSGTLRLTALPGFIGEHENPLVGLSRSNPALGLRLAGHYSRPIKL